MKRVNANHYVKSVRIRSYSGPHFSRIRTEYGEIQSTWRHPRKGVVRSFPNTYFQKRWVSKHNMENYWKTKTKKTFVGFFSIWFHPRKGMIQSSPNTYFQKRWFLLANTRWKWPKSEKLLKKTKEKFSSHFFDMTSSKKGRGPGLS